MSFIPFELNAKYTQEMQAQICEMYEISYFDNLDHKFIKMKADNTSMDSKNVKHDTGVKMTAFVVINKDTYADKEYGYIKLTPMDNSGSKMEPKQYHLRNNCMILIKSRCVKYEIHSNNQKVFVFSMKIGGPRSSKF
tara:strand:- start:52 stop:462 length:411 start_codon:yes stop_codon:yes gene_type:complete